MTNTILRQIGLGAAVGLMAFAAPAFAQASADTDANAKSDAQPSEIGYAEGSLGFSAIMQGDYSKAIDQIEHDNQEAPNDPAKLINLGHAHAQLGETAQAKRYYEAALTTKKSFDLILADGRVMNSRQAARKALRQITAQDKSR